MDNKKAHIPECGDFTSSKCSLVNEKSALNAAYREYTFQSNSYTMFPNQLLDDTKKCAEQILNNCLKNKVPIKVHSTIECVFEKIHFSSGIVTETVTSYFSTISVPIQSSRCIDKFFVGEKKKFNEHVESFTNRGSNWVLKECKTLTLRLVNYQPLNSAFDDSDESDGEDDEWRLYN